MDLGSLNEKVGAVMVVGGGIGGMQASLDLANAGFKVYLVEETTAIGGRMAQLDKTFPTNDCSMCIISPRLVEVGAHLNIEVITNTRVEGIEGEAGNFKVDILKRPRFIDLEKCTGCGECIANCPVEVLNEFDEGLGLRKAIYKRYPQAVPNAFAIDKKGISPCKVACPAHLNVQGYVALVSQGKYKEALALIRKDNPFPAVCGRVCTHPCENECSRGDVDEPIAICGLKRFVADFAEGEEIPKIEVKKEEKVAIIGSGPAGLTAAYYLALWGYQMTVFEALPVAGGMLSVGIPRYRLPKDILAKEIDYIKALGVEIKTNTPVGSGVSLDDLLKDGYQAIFLAIGAHLSRKLGIEGEDLEGVIHGVTFLKEVSLGNEVYLGEKVAVVGGGNVAIDSVRTALRLGSKEAFIVYRRSREEMPATKEEIEEAEEEGVKIHYLVAPVKVVGNKGRVVGLECIKMELGEPDESGRKRPVPVKGSEFTIDVDAVIPAIGQFPDISFISHHHKLDLTKGDTFKVDPVTLATNIPGIFAGGDAVSGPATVIEAIAAGKEAAISIDRYLRGEDLARDRTREFSKAEADTKGVEKIPRCKMPKLSPKERITNFREVQLGFCEEEALKEAERCLSCGICSECLQCVEACFAKAIDHEMKEERVSLGVGSVILSAGFEKFAPELKGEYGYGRMANVITSLELERILSASGPYEGKILRPSDKKVPEHIAWIQCVGSRDTSCGNGYCSSVCCMYATKQAIIAREHEDVIKPTIFYMDMRAYGKDFDKYYERAKEEYGVRYIRCMISRVVERPKTKNLLITYIDEGGKIKEEEFDLVVLSVGMVPSKAVKELAERLGIELNSYGFCQTDLFAPLSTSRPGIFVCGAFQGPKDIPETVAQASGAAAYASGIISTVRGTMVKEKEYPPELDVSGQEPRIGVFICRCGINIAGVVDVPALKEYAATLPGVVYTDENLFTCSQDTQQKIKEAIAEHNLNRVVVASCSPRTHESLFQETIREAGLNKYLFEMANIRDQCSWVHMKQKEEATNKAKGLVRMAVANARLIQPLKELSKEVNKRGLVIGGGLSGMTAALGLAEQGFKVYLVEREAELGGNLLKIHYTLNNDDVQKYLNTLIDNVRKNSDIEVITNAAVVDFSGYVGNYKTSLMTGPGMAMRDINHGIVIIATGGEELKPKEYLYGEDERVITQQELEERVSSNGQGISIYKNIVMIQCVGSRNGERPYCSRVCCSEAIKNALRLKEINPKIRIYILYRDIRTYGFMEDYYRKAREEGVIFIRYDPENKPDVNRENGNLRVSIVDPMIREKVTLNPDLLVLSSATIPHPNKELATMLKIPINEDGFFLEAHMKLRPVDFATEGIYLCGLAHSPKLIDESIAQALATVSRASTVLSKDMIAMSGIVSVVDEERCAACLTCVRVCPYDVPVINLQGKAEIEIAKCQGCGICASECPSKAIQLQHFTDKQIIAKSKALFMEAA